MNNLKHKKQIDINDIYHLTTNNRSRNKEVWLGIHFPNISLTVHQASQASACVVLEQHRGKPRVYCANRTARDQGIEAGMPLNSAYALCHTLHSVFRDKAGELNHLQACARSVMRFTPRIVLSKPDTLLLEVRASLRLFGGLKGLYQQLKKTFTIPHSIACAPVNNAAELMARLGIEKVVRSPDRLQSALGGVLLLQTPLEEKLRQQLAHCGLHSLRDLWRLPRPDLARRFSPDLLQYLDQLSGQDRMPRVPFTAEPCFRAEYDFDRETDDSAYILYAAEHLLKQAEAFLQIRASLSEKICFRLIYSRRSGTTQHWVDLNVYARRGGDRTVHFLPQITEQLQRLELESALTGLELHINQFRPRTDTTRDLFKRGESAADNWPVLLDLLFARLGRNRVYRLRLVADHRPEHAWQKRPVWMNFPDKSATACQNARPTWLFSQPLKCLGQRFKLISDAERLESGWWDDRDLRREYYQGIAPSGRRCWLYRDLKAANEQWYLHGLFA